jgi:dihydroorotate dehydrogenase (NAD+) catalytic subunit
VQLGTVNFTHPDRWVDVLAGIEFYLIRHGVERVSELIGALEIP